MGKLKRIYYNDSQDWYIYPHVAVEGLGFFIDMFPRKDTTLLLVKVTECYEDGQLNFSEKDFMINQTGIDDKLDTSCRQTNVKYDPSQEGCDLSGNVIHTPISNIIVIQNGSKLVVP